MIIIGPGSFMEMEMIRITRDNVNALLDRGLIYAHMTNGNWWRVRRNGMTRTWKTDVERLYIPIKAGLRTTSRITEHDFRDRLLDENDLAGVFKPCLDPEHFRHVDDVPLQVRGNVSKAVEV